MDYYSYEDINRNKGKAVLCYLGLLWLIPLIAWRKSPYMRFHLNQGLNVWIYTLVISLINRIIVVGVPTGVFTGIWGFVFTVAEILSLALVVLGIINTLNGQTRELPIIGRIRLIK